MIQVENLVKEFDGLRALDGLCLNVPDGCVYGLVGPNGAGKTTVIRHLTGVYRQDSGCVRIDGQPVYENPAVKQRIACIPDELYARGSETIRDMMQFYRHLYPRFDEARFRQLGEVFALDEKRPLRRFSKGMQKQAAFWLAISSLTSRLTVSTPSCAVRCGASSWTMSAQTGRACSFPRTICASWRTYATMSASCTTEK